MRIASTLPKLGRQIGDRRFRIDDMSAYLTPEQDIVLSFIFGYLGEERFNRSMEEYAAIAARAPKLIVLQSAINEALRARRNRDKPRYEICSFKLGDRHYQYKPFPNWVSLETVRRAWANSGMRELQLQHRRQNS
jgi:hypothetical protein